MKIMLYEQCMASCMLQSSLIARHYIYYWFSIFLDHKALILFFCIMCDGYYGSCWWRCPSPFMFLKTNLSFSPNGSVSFQKTIYFINEHIITIKWLHDKWKFMVLVYNKTSNFNIFFPRFTLCFNYYEYYKCIRLYLKCMDFVKIYWLPQC